MEASSSASFASSIVRRGLVGEGNPSTIGDPTAWATLDGFSPGAVLVAHFPEGVDLAASRVPSVDDPEASLAPDSPTLLVEADAPGSVRIPHFAENDVGPGADARPWRRRGKRF